MATASKGITPAQLVEPGRFGTAELSALIRATLSRKLQAEPGEWSSSKERKK